MEEGRDPFHLETLFKLALLSFHPNPNLPGEADPLPNKGEYIVVLRMILQEIL